ncbi:MAG: phenylalanine--tRNA ligase subunit alpha [Candidatus Omnitrophica bacterium CG11_big_fil_rev_8_21_14_0_20_41_12]|nr:MAG: phenylalanine--tRNA ligase subunit alpha [Candidatus Omnitrophica bacterium CG11_big_fil_rev_8_21_14_0_20_41_12]
MDIKLIQAQIENDLAAVTSLQALEEVRIKYLGRKGLLAELTGSISGLALEQRGAFGKEVNVLKNKLLSLIEEKGKFLKKSGSVEKKENLDVGLPGIAQELGGLHPITQVINEICAIFTRMGFSVVQGPEIETEYNNFTGLNIPLEHPSRDAFDTFYLKNYPKLLLRSHTSPVQVRAMKAHQPPLAIVVPGRVYRPDAVDASHLFMFHQVEGFLVDENVKFSDLKGILELFAKSVFGQDIKMRFRPHFFPFTEPSAEVDISCIICKGSGCSVCGRKGWLEILGAGLIHPDVFKQVGYDSKKYTGFAFGMGIERIAMLKYGINDIRLFFENDLRFLKQF